VPSFVIMAQSFVFFKTKLLALLILGQ